MKLSYNRTPEFPSLFGNTATLTVFAVEPWNTVHFQNEMCGHRLQAASILHDGSDPEGTRASRLF